MTHQIAVLCPSKSYFSRHSFYNLILFYLLFFFSTVNLHSCSVVLQVPAYNHPLPFPLLFISLCLSPLLSLLPFPSLLFLFPGSLFLSPLPSPSFPSPIPLFFWKSWLQQSAWNERCIPTHTLGAAAPSHVYANLCVCARVCVCISCVCAPGCSTAARICSFLCAAHSAACLLLPPLRKGIPCRLRYCRSQSVSVETREEEEEDKKTCRKATLTDRGQSRISEWFFFCEDVQRLFTRKTLCVRDLLLTFVPLNCAHMWEGTLCIHVREWQSVCVSEWVIVWRVNVCSRCGLSGLAVCVLWYWRR